MKFRVWDRVRKKMYVLDYMGITQRHFSNPVLVFGNKEQIVDEVFDDYLLEGSFEDYVIMQFTGLKDKNGKGIYEGDIVNAIAEEDYQEETRTSDVIFAKDFQWQIRYRKCYEHGLPVNWGGWASLEVVGNIYENPNLLEETK